MSQLLTLPPLDENVTEYKILQWLKQVGESFASNESLLEVETDKVTMEVVAPQAGKLVETLVTIGAVVQVGDLLGKLEAIADQTDSALEGKNAIVNSKEEPMPVMKKMTPVVTRMVSEHQLDISKIVGSGRKGRVTKKDVQAYLKHQSSQVPVKGKPGEALPAISPTLKASNSKAVQEILTDACTPLSPMRRSIAEHMMRSVQNSPHVTTVFEFDFSAVAKHRKEHKAGYASEGIKLTYMAYIMQATATALRHFPLVNSVFHGLDQGIECKSEINVGLIVAVENGLYAPVIHGADQLNLRGLASKIEDVAQRGRVNKLKSQDLSGGTFTISNHGAAGSLMGTPIIFQPQAGILGVGKIEERIKIIDGAIHIRPMAYISFSFDHRVMDGATADSFVSDIKRQIETHGHDL